MASLERQSVNFSREIRQVAITHLQRVLLGQFILLEDADQAQVEEAFNRVVFPLVDELLKPEVFNRDPAGMPETRLRAASLLCKAFMQLEVKEGGSQADIRVVWIQVLDLLDRLMNIDRQDQLVCIHICSTVTKPLICNLIPARGDSRDAEKRHSRHERGRTARSTDRTRSADRGAAAAVGHNGGKAREIRPQVLGVCHRGNTEYDGFVLKLSGALHYAQRVSQY